jgi:hypothetical protein
METGRVGFSVGNAPNWFGEPTGDVDRLLRELGSALHGVADELKDQFQHKYWPGPYGWAFMLAGLWSDRMTRDPVSMTAFPAAGVKKLELDHHAGSVTIIGTDADTLSVGSVERDVGKTCHTEVELSGDTLEVDTNRGFFDGGPCEVDVIVTVPNGAAILADVDKGVLDMRDIAGDVVVRMGAGTLNARVTSSDVKVRMGAGNMFLRWLSLPEKGNVSICGGLANTTLSFPSGAVVDANITSGFSGVSNSIRTDPDAGMKVSAKIGMANVILKYNE